MSLHPLFQAWANDLMGEHYAHYSRLRHVAEQISEIKAADLSGIDTADIQFLADALSHELQERGLYDTEEDTNDNPF